MFIHCFPALGRAACDRVGLRDRRGAMLRRAGNDVTVFERGERRRRLAPTPIRARLRRPSHLYEFSFAPNPRWSRRYAPQARDPGVPGGRVAALRRRRPVRTGTEVTARALGRRALGARDQRRAARGRRADHRLRQLSTPSVPPIPGLDCFDGPGLPHRRAGATTSTSPAGAWPWSGPAAARSRSCPRSQPPSRRSTSTSARRAGRSRSWTYAYSRAHAARCSSASRALQRLDRAVDLRLPRSSARTAMTRHRWLLQPSAPAGAHARSAARSSDPELRAQGDADATRSAASGSCSPTTGIRPSPSRTSTWSTERDRGGDRRGRPDRGRHASARPTCSCSPPASRATASSRRWRSPARGGRTLAERSGRTCRAPTSALTVPGFPNLFLLYGPNTNGGTGSVISTIECVDATRARRARELDAHGCATDRGPPRRRRGLRPPAARRPRRHRLALAAARTGTSTRTATTRRSGPGPGRSTAAGRRRSTRAPTRLPKGV